MNRRELLKMIAALTGGAVVGADVFLSGCKNETTAGMTFTDKDIAFLDEVGETILPATDTPGAKAAHIGEFMKTIVNDCYEEDDQKTFHEGMKKLDDACEKKTGHSFMNASSADRQKLLTELDTEAKAYQDKRNDFNKDQSAKEKQAKEKGDKNFKKERMEPHYFTLMKQLTIWGFFTSKEVANSSLVRYKPVPGKFEGCIDYKKGDKIFISLG
jgi:hypothetical protein